ncbi:MAG: AraC family transcriptional regulator [SAR86 cluster bacterium]|uniref:AraC family transcriptional regulator n=1 Tax=SAR86 cluster bacterium TaxID=2030880 RepID=A0A2A4X023_9GAMM|nr:MAG: AraC family transcriptional regulator [SAR86 cluster bacterium]
MDLLSSVLAHMKLTGTLYFRTSFTSPWGVKVPLHPNVSRFHYVHRGRCIVRVGSEASPVQLEQGDLIIINRGAEHTLFSDLDEEHLAAELETVISESGFTGYGTLVYGEASSKQESQLVCGHFAFDENAKHPLIDKLPSYILIRNYGDTAGSWMEHTLRIIGSEAATDNIGASLISLKLSEIIFAQALRVFLKSEENSNSELRGFVDSNISKALKEVHIDPSRSWNLGELAAIAGLSRTGFVSRFTSLMSETPLTYITNWRMQVARKMLVESNAPIIEVAESSGYQSEASFGRVFKKHFDLAPASYRRFNQSVLVDETN